MLLDAFSHIICHVLCYQHLPPCDFAFCHANMKIHVCLTCIMDRCCTFRFRYFGAEFLKYECGLVREKFHPVVQYGIINLWSSVGSRIYFVALWNIGTYFPLNCLIYFWFASWFAALCRVMFNIPEGNMIRLVAFTVTHTVDAEINSKSMVKEFWHTQTGRKITRWMYCFVVYWGSCQRSNLCLCCLYMFPVWLTFWFCC